MKCKITKNENVSRNKVRLFIYKVLCKYATRFGLSTYKPRGSFKNVNFLSERLIRVIGTKPINPDYVNFFYKYQAISFINIIV